MMREWVKKVKKKYSRWTKKLTKKQKRLWELLKFLIIFNLMAIPLQLIIFFEVTFYPLAFIERAQVSFILNLFGIGHELYDVPYGENQLPVIQIGGKVLAIGEACTAIRSLLAFIALVIASPKSWKSKKKAMILLPVIYFANVIRILSLALVSLSFPSIFELIHILVWREGLVILITVLWVLWIKYW